MNHYRDVLKKYAVFEGRATRSEFWYFSLVNFLIGFTVMVLSFFLVKSHSTGLLLMMQILLFLYFIGILVPSLAVSVRRLHDTGKSGLWYLINFIPGGGIVLLVFFTTDSQIGRNAYGPNPKGIGNEDGESLSQSQDFTVPSGI